MTLHEAAVIAAQADLSRFPYLSSEEVREALRVITETIKAGWDEAIWTESSFLRSMPN